jgi:hypothetical protein
VGPPDKIRRKAMTTIGEIIFRRGKGGLTTGVTAVMGRTVSSLYGTNDKTIKIYP